MSLPLTKPNPKLEELIRNTPPGMAHWAGTGPKGKTCAQCDHFGTVFAEGSARGNPGRCKLYQRRMGRVGDRIPEHTPACRYFE